MSFLAPLFFLGALAIAMPFWLHRMQTQSSDRKPFSSAMLLQTTEQRVHVRKKLKYLVLLALRVALLALLVFAFAKPLWTNPETLPGPGPDGTDYLTAIDEWVKTGEAPEQLPAPFRELAGQATAGGRILCAYPMVVTYDGEGDPRDSSSFFCAAPK